MFDLAMDTGTAAWDLGGDGTWTRSDVGEDGAPLVGATTADSVVLPPGKRFDVLVTADDHPGDSWLRTTTTAGADADGDQYPDVAMVRVAVAGRAVGRLPSLSE